MSDDHKVQYYTGLPSAKLLQHVFELVIPFPGSQHQYYWRSFIMTLMKLHLIFNCGYQDLAYHLEIAVSTVTTRFHQMLEIMNACLDFLIFWPDQEELRKTMSLFPGYLQLKSSCSD